MSQNPRDEGGLREVVLETTGPVLTIDESGYVVYANDQVGDLLGRDPDAILGRAVTTFLRGGARALGRVRDAIDPATDPGRVEVTFRTAGDRTVEAELLVATTTRDGEQFVTLTVARRVDPRDESPATGQQAGDVGQPIEQLLESGGDPSLLFDPEDATVVDCNERTRDLLEVPAGTLTGQSVRGFVEAPTVFCSFLDDVVTADEPRREEFAWQTKTGETRPIQVVASPVQWDGERLVFARARDVTERNELRTQRRRRTAALDVVHRAVAVLDGSLEHRYTNAAYRGLFGREDDLRGEPFGRLVGDRQVEQEITAALEDVGCWQGRVDLSPGEGTPRSTRAAFEKLEDGSVVVVVRGTGGDPIDTRSGNRDPGGRLTALADAHREVVSAADPEGVANACVEAAADVLDYEVGCLRLESDTTLQPEAVTAEAAELVDVNPGFELGLSDAGRAYRTGEPVVRERDSDAAVDDVLATSVHVPVGDHGVLTAGTTEEQRVGPAQRDALGLLAAGVESALDRLEAETESGDRPVPDARSGDRPVPDATVQGDDATARGRSPGGTPEQFGSAKLVQELVGDLVSTDSRAEIEELVCSGLAETDAYAGAWVAAVDATGEQLRTRETAGLAEDALAPVDDASLPAVADGAVETAVREGEPTVLESTTLLKRETAASGEGGRAEDVCVVPLQRGEKLFGLLGVHAPVRERFGPGETRSLAVLGEAIGFAFGALENERLLLSDEFVQLEFQVTDPSCLSVALSATLDTSVSMKRTVQNANGEHLSYVRIEDTSPEAAVQAAEAIDEVRGCRVVADYEYGCLVEVIRECSGAEVMMEFGATMRAAEAESGRGTLVIEAPHTVDVRRIVSAYQSYNPESELLRKRRVDRPVRAADQLRADVEDDLTEKQLSAVSAAYYSGYYEWPRESTAEDVADSMGISASTLHQHLRHAHQKLLSSVLETTARSL